VVFLFGFLSPRTPRVFGVVGIVANIILYGSMWASGTDMPFLNQMSICFISVAVIGIVLTIVKPLPEPIVLPENNEIALESSPVAKLFGWVVLAMTAVLYIIFW